jgi:hypothetical protein
VPLLDFTSIDHLQVFDAKSFDPLEFPETPDYYQRKFRWRVVGKVIGRDALTGLDYLDIFLRAVKPFA